MSKKTVIFVLAAVLAVIIALFAFNSKLKTVTYRVDSGGEAKACRIVFITDLHGDKYGENQRELLEAVRAQMPDLVLLGGDLFDDEKTWENSLAAIKPIAKEYPCFYVTGNHEIRSGKAAEFKEILIGYGVTVLDFEAKQNPVSFGGINIFGFDDNTDVVNGEEYFEKIAKAKENVPSGFDILLIHRPEDAKEYSAMGFDLMLSGHAHGGQWRLPFFQNGLYAPGQGFFPEYSGGRFEVGQMALIVSRGLARESTPIPRIFNRPELVVIEIE